jgi:hypothetical protein
MIFESILWDGSIYGYFDWGVEWEIVVSPYL